MMVRRVLLATASLGAFAMAVAPAARAAGLGADWKPSPPLWEVSQVQAQTQAQSPAPAAPSLVAPPTVARPPLVQRAQVPAGDEPRPAAAAPAPGALPSVLPRAAVVETREAPSERLRRADELPASADVIPDRFGVGSEADVGLPAPELRSLPRPYQPPEVPPTAEGDPRTSVVADELGYDETQEVVTARGGVELIYEGRVLRAETVRYDTRADRVTAEGDVVVMETDGSVYFFDYAELTGDMKEGFAREVTLLLADRSRATAQEIVREDQTNVLRQAIYTACDPCEDADADPLWRVRARRVVHDEADKTITYRDAWLELGGVPVAYTPYLSHPDPTVRRKSGILAPSYGTSDDLGAEITVPYYLVIDESQDAMGAVRYTSDEGPVLEASYAGLYEDGSFDIAGSITKDSEGRVRNHVQSGLMWHFDETWRGGLSLNLASDDTYMRKYDYSDEAWLVSKAFVEGFDRRTYARGRGFYFQSLREGRDPGNVPVVLPELTYSFTSNPTDAGSFWTVDATALSLSRSEGTDTRRLAAEAAWHTIHYGSLGDVTELVAALRADIYNIDAAEKAEFRTVDSTTTGRVIPTVGAIWRYPFTRDNGWFTEVVEPTVSAFISPRGQNRDDIPNEDSRDFEFDVTNLFARNRFTGWDRVENGPRANYGVRWAGYWPEGDTVSVTLGQSWHLYNDGFFAEQSGLADEYSDVVGRVTASLSPYFDAQWRFRLDSSDLTLRTNEVWAAAGVPVFRVAASYLQVAGDTTVDDQFGDREELAISARSRISRYWSVYGGAVLDLNGEADPRSWRLGGLYEDECLALSATVQRDFTEDRDYDGGTSAVLRVVFKTLGEINLGDTAAAVD